MAASTLRRSLTGASVGLLCLAAPLAAANNVQWADWTAASTGIAGSASGTIGSINVNFSGELWGAQTAGGTNYWSPGTAYVSGSVWNPPPASDILQCQGATPNTYTITFSQAVTNPYMAICSLGTPGVLSVLTFNQPFTILSQGPGYFGSGTMTQGAGNTLLGSEGYGVIQFIGTMTSITWTDPQWERWHGYQVALVPAPGAAALLGLGSVLCGRRRR
ncbi:MAG: hypothetical protein DYG94_05325 [Leptolyngbya sp. PLA3]|nr:MAG: hypothetical protein EDM82_04800 [Cyanobacteria bacterium CYA]MCE7968155.1 hypothetical protein [Leptolyngbya sp. PL-A3]